jgi:hypothetical protein
MKYSGAGGKLIYEKKPKVKNLVTLSNSQAKSQNIEKLI